MNEFDLKDLLKLAYVPKVSSTRLRNLINHFKNPSAVLEASLQDLRKVDLIDIKIATNILHADQDDAVDKQLRQIEKTNSKIISFWDPEYPLLLKNISYPPAILFVRGQNITFEANTIAIVGTRNPTQYGIECVKYFSSHLGMEGITVISGLAIGIDTYAHSSVLESNGHTIAVLGSGVDRIYPEQNKKLAEEIIQKGFLISEYPMGTEPSPKNFPARNRIISGLSLGVIVIESDQDGGSMITAQFALDQNREVFAVPGNINSKKSRGTNKIIKQGAKLIQNLEDVLNELNIKLKKNEVERTFNKIIQLSLIENKVLNILDSDPKHVDNISDETDLSISETLVTLLNLELKGLVKQNPGKMFQVVD